MIRTLNGIRFILILMIMISHSTLPIPQALHDYLGEFPVTMFFIISGFVLSLSYGEKLRKGEVSNKHFFLSRIFKLYPLHLFILAIIIPMDVRLGHLSWYQIIAHITLLQSWIPFNQFVFSLNGPAWFLSDIIFFYFTFKWLYCWITSSPRLHTIVIISAYIIGYVFLTLYIKEDYSSGYIYFFPLFRMIDFCIGIFLYKFYRSQNGTYLYHRITKRISTGKAQLIDTMMIIMLVGIYPLSQDIAPNIRCAVLYWIPSVIMIFYVIVSEQGKGWLAQVLHNKFLLWLSNISFEIYLCHALCLRLVQSIFLKIFGNDIPYLAVQFTISLALTLSLSWICKKYIVMPSYHYLSKAIA